MTTTLEFYQASIESLERGSFPPNSERCYFLVKKNIKANDINLSPKVIVSSFQELWEKYFEATGEEKPLKKPSPAGEEGYQKALVQLMKNPKREWVPIRLTADSFLLFGLMGLESDYFNLPLVAPVETKKAPPTKPAPKEVKEVKKPAKVLPQLVLIHTSQRKTWPYGLLGDTKTVKDFLKFPEEKEKISMYVTNVNKQFGPGWNLKEDAAEKVKEKKGELFELFEFDSVEDYVKYVNEESEED